ncbi:formate dehydrogenase accessory protein FdhE [Desulfovibrio sp. OttesenSCG-928-A18]|nr:formate dehydrogenase accessory protein FdhE [Desulfovibrio sp. OttesenSCG-928-A18]
MSIPKVLVTRLAKQHPESALLLKAFVPLLDAQNALSVELPEIVMPELDRAAFAQGRAWAPVLGDNLDLYFDAPFLKKAPKKIASAAARGMPEIAVQAKALGAYLAKNPEKCRELGSLGMSANTKKAAAWAKKNEQDPGVAGLFATHLAGAAASRVARAAEAIVLPPWEFSACPICGGFPHGSALRGKEGKRSLQCSLCRHEWQFSRTTCPVCGQNNPADLPIMFLEHLKYERGEGCSKCMHYLLGVDFRELAGDTPLELYLLCMLPMDLLMQENGYSPGIEAIL